MRTFLTKAGLSLAFLAVIAGNGWHLATMQGYAWACMFHAYSQMMPADEAWTLTISGKELCTTCIAVQEATESMPDDLQDALIDNKIVIMPIPAASVIVEPAQVAYSESRDKQMPALILLGTLNPPPRA